MVTLDKDNNVITITGKITINSNMQVDKVTFNYARQRIDFVYVIKGYIVITVGEKTFAFLQENSDEFDILQLI